tara:strand:- start:166 stop:609 length:444 start_codon:yes stop_codon:yes gene_type:complete
MASLISASEKSGIAQSFEDIFDTFKREVVVHKEPIKVVSDLDLDMFYGYDVPYDKPTNFSYTPVSGSYYATVRYADQQGESVEPELNSKIPQGTVRIKVKEEAMNFIESGKTEKITFDNKSFNINSDVAVKKFLDSTFYVYHLEEVS